MTPLTYSDPPRTVGDVQLGEVRAQFAEHQRRRNLSEDSTIGPRDMILRNFGEYLAPRCYWQATPQDIDLFAPTSHPKTRDWYLSNLSAFYKWGIKHDLTDVDPTMKVDRPELPRRKSRPGRREHIRAALANADAREACMIGLAVYCSLRCKDMCGLKVEDIDMDTGWVFVRDGKGGHERDDPIPYEFIPILRAFLEHHQVRYRGKEWLFPNHNGGHLKNTSVSRIGNDVFKRLGLPTRMHMLRHWYGTWAGRLVKMEVLTELMGHADPKTTKQYRQIGDDELAAVRGLSLA